MQQYGIQALGTLPVHNHTALVQGGQINNDDLFQSCGARAYITANQALVTITPTKILFNAVLYDIGGDFNADGVDSEFVCPRDGFYFVSARARFEQMNDDAIHILYIYVNGGSISTRIGHVNNDVEGQSAMIADLLALNAGDLITIWAYHNHGANRNLLAGITGDVTSASIFKIGE